MAISKYELDNTRLTNRFLTTNKAKAFELKQRLEKESIIKSNGKKTHWLVGRRITDRVVIEIDSLDKDNLNLTVKFYSNLLKCQFVVLKTLHGYHIIQKHPEDKQLLQYSRCRILAPWLSFNGIDEFEKDVDMFFKGLKDGSKDLSLTELSERSRNIPHMAKEAGLDYHQGNIDVLHALIGIQRKRYVLRISKKNKYDKMELIQ